MAACYEVNNAAGGLRTPHLDRLTRIVSMYQCRQVEHQTCQAFDLSVLRIW